MLTVALVTVVLIACSVDPEPTPTVAPPAIEATLSPAPAETPLPTPVPKAPTLIPTSAAPTSTAVPSSSTESPSQVGEQTLTANIVNFTHKDLSVRVGTTVAWVNGDRAPHTTTSGAPGDETGIWDSGDLVQNAVFSFTFNEAGTFPYFCSIHP